MNVLEENHGNIAKLFCALCVCVWTLADLPIKKGKTHITVQWLVLFVGPV